MTQRSNNAPRLTWRSEGRFDGYERQFLNLNGRPTPYFIRVAFSQAHRTWGQKVGLFGSGMGNEVRRRDGSRYRVAATIGAWDRIGEAKARAERLALEDA